MSTNTTDIITLTGGIDVGNGYVKGVIQNTKQSTFDEIDLPSAVVSTSRTSPKVPLADADAASVMAGDFYNQIDCSLTTPLVAASDRRIFGRAALSVRGSKFTEFEVLGKHSKADQELSKVLVLGVFAAKALRDYVRENGALPDHELRAQVRAGLALPISEFVARRYAYAAEFIGLLGSSDPTVHLVTIKNFSTPVSVRLQFIDVQVMAEGASAQFAITDKGEPLAQALLDDLRTRDASIVEGVSSSDLVAVQHTIGVDVGEGTVNFPVFTDGRFNPEAATTLDEGYGTALMNAMERMSESDATLRFSSRKQLADFLHAEPSVLVKNRHQRAAGFVEDEASYLVDEIVSAFGDVLSQAGATTEVVYVYGGGSGPIKHLLHPALLKAAGDVPVLYLDSSYSRHLNREGLYIAARHVEQKALAAEPARKRSKGAA
ncbi:ParM/StbA family protein [Streptomyces mobaraensis]|uniref:ParM/StbA family protein n=1 Tax=Streptomyces mobaraensis TaxID=35621 RepID=A0A5N5W3B3_STRMB|nr:ParM/StbA family protein [Streptomyces mobaraensis]KAB7835911.1 ParM/StbA family protein [Streptomyces mobaraensis]